MIYVDGKKPSRIFLYKGGDSNIVNKVVVTRGTASQTVWEMFPRTCSPSLGLGDYGSLDFTGCSLKEPFDTVFDGGTSRVVAKYKCTARTSLFGGNLYDLSYAKQYAIRMPVKKLAGFPEGVKPVDFTLDAAIDAKLYICPVGGRIVRKNGKIDIENSDFTVKTRKLRLFCNAFGFAEIFGELELKDGDYVVYTTGDAIKASVSATLQTIDPE